jgi:hypothetical protein
LLSFYVQFWKARNTKKPWKNVVTFLNRSNRSFASPKLRKQ